MILYSQRPARVYDDDDDVDDDEYVTNAIRCSRYYTGIDYNSECYANEKPVKCNKVKDCEDKKHDCHTDPDYFCK